MNEAGGSCFPSYEQIASETGLCRRTVVSQVDRALREGWLTKTQCKTAKAEWRHNEYQATVPESYPQKLSTGGAIIALGSATDDMGVVQPLHPSTSVNSSYNYEEPVDKSSIQEQVKSLTAKFTR